MCKILSRVLATIDGIRIVIEVIDHLQVVDNAHTTNHSRLILICVLSFVYLIRFLATYLSQSHCNFEYHSNYSTCTVFNSHTKSSWHSLIPSTAESLNSDRQLSFLTQFLTAHYLTHFIFFWLDNPLKLFWLPNKLSVIVGFSLYSLGSGLTENMSIAGQWMSSIVAYSF
jgi:hypothetical protein